MNLVQQGLTTIILNTERTSHSDLDAKCSPSFISDILLEALQILNQKRFCSQPMQKKRSWGWIHTGMIGCTLGHRQLHETPFLSDMQLFMAFSFQPPHKHSLRCTHVFWVVNSSVKGQSLTVSSLAFVQHLDQHCQYIITFSIIICYRNEEYQTT